MRASPEWVIHMAPNTYDYELYTRHSGFCDRALVSRMEKQGIYCLARGVFLINPARHNRPC
jgi:hypothetical protein